jgi:His/Glu/Gln/Arg/opine family amino acid ABC transporter permease subunit
MIAIWNALIDVLPGNWELFREWPYWRYLLQGLSLSARIAVVSIVLSIVIGVVMAVARLAPVPIVRWLATTYVEIFRATPLLLLLFFIFFGAGRFNTGWARDIPVANLLVDDNNGDLTPFAAAVLALALYNSAVVAEIMRAGILSVPKGIIEASRALGLGYLQSMRYVAVPMAVRRMAPGLVSQLITLYKDTSLASIIAVFELVRRGRLLFETPAYGNPTIEVLIIVSLMYFIPCYGLSLLAQRLERGPDQRARAATTVASMAPVSTGRIG